VGVGLDDGGVHAEGGVVDEHPVAEQGQVDAPLDGVAVGIQCRRDVGAVEPEVESEMVAGPCRYADERDVVAPCHVGDHACEPSPPAIPITSAPAATACSASAAGRPRAAAVALL
jgi:hypothetical protein